MKHSLAFILPKKCFHFVHTMNKALQETCHDVSRQAENPP